jgi:hypothetical protein
MGLPGFLVGEVHVAIFVASASVGMVVSWFDLLPAPQQQQASKSQEGRLNLSHEFTN